MAELSSKKSLTNKLKREFLDSINASGGKNRLISLMNKDDKIFIEMYKEGIKLIPRDIAIKKEGKIVIQLDIPNGSNSKRISNSNSDEVIDIDSVVVDEIVE